MAVTRVTINSHEPFAEGRSFGAVGAYELLGGTLEFAVDPNHADNSRITDIELAPRDASGLVTFNSNFRLLRPVDPVRGNRRLLLDVPNRGRGPILRNFNDAPDVPADKPLQPGNGFLMHQGFTIVWCGWQHDSPNAPGVLRLNTPEAVTSEGRVSGRLMVTFQNNGPSQVQYLADRIHVAYPTNDLNDRDAFLTVQNYEDGPEEIVPRSDWSFAKLEDGQPVPDASHIYMASGFVPGKVYQLVYSTTGAPIVGLGLLATRDCASFLRYATAEEGNPCADGPDAQGIQHAYAFGSSQSGRFLRDLLHLGLNLDEQGRTVFDGLIPHVAGAKHGEFNHRFAQPSSQASRSPNSLFPYSDLPQTDTETGRTDGVLARLAEKGALPKVIYTYTSSEYWAGGGCLTHVDLEGTQDLEVPPSVRIYQFGRVQHPLPSPELRQFDPGNGAHGQHYFNTVDYRPLLRAALVSLDRWVTTGEPAPPSKHPHLVDGTAVPPEQTASTFSSIPGVTFPRAFRQFTRLDFGPQPGVATNHPPKIGAPYPNLVPAVDKDGNETCGLIMPQAAVPLATYTGWNTRDAAIGGEGHILSSGGATGGTLAGSTIPFAATKAEREATGDPRLSIEERYPSKEAYLQLVQAEAERMVAEGYLLTEDLDTIQQQAANLYEQIATKVREPQLADD